eukprot:gene18982-biopygen16015
MCGSSTSNGWKCIYCTLVNDWDDAQCKACTVETVETVERFQRLVLWLGCFFLKNRSARVHLPGSRAAPAGIPETRDAHGRGGGGRRRGAPERGTGERDRNLGAWPTPPDPAGVRFRRRWPADVHMAGRAWILRGPAAAARL